MDVSKIKKITVIGTGVMGPDISLGFSMAGYDVTGVDIESAILDRAARKISVNCKRWIQVIIKTYRSALSSYSIGSICCYSISLNRW